MRGVERFGVDKGGDAGGVVVLFPALQKKAVGVIEADGRGVRFSDVKRQELRAGSRCGGFETVKKLGGDAALSVGGGDLKGLDVGDGLGNFGEPLCDGEAGHLEVFFGGLIIGNPGGGVGACDELLHIATGKAERRLKAGLLDGVELGKVCGTIETVEHKLTVCDEARKKRKAILARRMAFA